MQIEKELAVGWWEKYKEDDVLFLDCEFVSIPIGHRTNKRLECKQVAATVDIVNEKLETIYSTSIRHKTGSYLVNPMTKLINGFKEDDFDKSDYPELSSVSSDVRSLFKNKLIVTVGGVADFRSLNLDVADFDNFDLQKHWWTTKVDQHGVTVEEKHSLRSLAKFYLEQNIHGSNHTSLEDAKTTAKLFGVYKSLKLSAGEDSLSRECPYPHNDIPVIPSAIKTLKSQHQKK